MSSPKTGYFTILSFVGGGIRGLLSATILQRLQTAHGNVMSQTSMYAGCSTGSIITSELLNNPCADNLINLFTKDEINFYNNMNTDPDKAAYPIADVLGSQEKLHGETPISASTKNVLMVSFNVGSVEPESGGIGKMMPTPWKPLMFTNMLGSERDKLDGLEGNSETSIARAAASSGAMPGQLGSMDGNVDGAFFNHDPTVAAIALALRNGWPLEQIAAITIGTGYMPYWLQSDTRDWGANQWMKGDDNPFDNITPFLMNQQGSSPVLDMSLNGTSAELMPHIAKMLLGDRYVNLNPRLPCFIPENSTNQQAIELLQHSGQSVDISEARELMTRCWDNATPSISRSAKTPMPGVEKTGGTPAPVAGPATKPIVPKDTSFFILQAYSNDYVLDVENASSAPGAHVISWSKKSSTDPDANNQLWRFVSSGQPGWWYLQSQMGTGYVMTLAGDSPTVNARIVVESIQDGLRDRQLWSLVSSEDLGYFFIQSKLAPSTAPSINPNSYVPTVIGIAAGDDGSSAYGSPLNYSSYANLTFAFIPDLSDAQSNRGGCGGPTI